MTALAESDLRVLANPNDPTGNNLPSTASAGCQRRLQRQRRQILGPYAARQSVLAVIDTDASHLDCGGIGPGLPLGGAAHFRATRDLPDLFRCERLRARRRHLRWRNWASPTPGGNGPNGFDCSGLIQQAWARAGVGIGRTTYDQMLDATPTTPASLQPGDLVLIPGATGSLASPGHVGMYLGLGQTVHAPQPATSCG